MNPLKLIYLLILSSTLYANNCPKYAPLHMEDALVIMIPIYDISIIQQDIDCDGLIDDIDPDMDDDGVVNDLDAFPLDPSETKDSDNDGIGDNSETPVANEQSITIEKNTLTNPIILTGKDDDEISFIVLSQPVHGKLSGEAPTLNYTPDVNYTGADSFTFEVNDGTFTSLLATIIIDIKDDITPPVITLVGENPQYIEKNTPYVELSATADDGSVVMVDSSQVNTTLNGTYSVTYRAEDDANNTAIEVSRTVIVDDDITTFYVQDINISDSRNANIVGNYDMNGSAMTVSPDGNTAYVSGDSGGNILDISDPSSPVYISSYANNSPNYIGPENVALSKDGNTLYVAAGNEGLKVYDVSSPETPILLDDYIGTVVVGGEDIGTNIYVPGGYTSNCKAKDITLSKDGRTAYVACGANSIDIYLAARISSLQIIDVSTPSNLQLIGAYELDDGGFGTSVVLSEDEDIAYLASGYAGLKSINILNPSTPTLIATLDTQNAKDIILGKRNNNIIYVADGSSGLKIIDTINNNLNLIGKYTTTVADELTLTQDENNIYISSDTGIENINISDVRNPKFITALNIEHRTYATSLSIDETKLYTIGSGGFKILDVTTSSYSTEKNFSNVNMKLLLNNTLGKEIDLTITTDRNDIISVGSYINTLNFTDYNNQAIDIPIEAVTNAVGETIITMTLSHSGKTFIKKIVFIVY